MQRHEPTILSRIGRVSHVFEVVIALYVHQVYIVRCSLCLYLAKCTQNVVLIVLVGIVSHAHQTIEAPKADESVHQILVLLEDLLEREERPTQVTPLGCE